MTTTKYAIDYAPSSRATCPECKEKIEKGSLRGSRISPNPFTPSGNNVMKKYYHMDHLLTALKRARANTPRITSTQDLEHFDKLQPTDQEFVANLIAKE
jgi:Poly(ADP-ribose) polymerase and DNA-Ligase Zn-finger region